jgi:hypothetical protein
MKPRTHNPNKHKPLKPIEIAQQRRVPLHKVANEGSKEEMAEFGRKWLAKTHDVKAYNGFSETDAVFNETFLISRPAEHYTALVINFELVQEGQS